MSQLGESLIRFDSGRTHKQANQEAGVAGHAPGTCMFSGIKLKYFRSRCRSVTLPPFFFVFFFASLLIFQNNLSSQENVTLPCQLWLQPSPPPPPPTVSLSLSLFTLTSRAAPSPLLFSHLITSFFSLPLSFASPLPPLWGSVVQSVPRNTMFNILQRIYKWIKYKLPHMVTHIPQEEICNERKDVSDWVLSVDFPAFFSLAVLSLKSLTFNRLSLSSPSTFILSISDEKYRKMCRSKASSDKVTLVLPFIFMLN